MKDAKVNSAIANWAPRFVANGVDMNDFRRVTDSLESWNQWFDAWYKIGEEHEQLGNQAFEQKRYRSAGSHFVHASINYHFGKYLFVHDIEKLKIGTVKSSTCYRKALSLFTPRGMSIEIPFEGHLLPGYLRLPAQVIKPAVVVIVCGLDSTKEEMHNIEELLLERGLAALAFDGPGQGESEFKLSIRPDYEKVISAVIDYLEYRPEVDAKRVGLMGISLGGYYVCRGAAAEPRVKAVVDVAGPFCFGAHWEEEPPLTRQAFQVRSGAKNEAEAEIRAKSLTLDGLAAEIVCPLLIVHGKKDKVIPVEEAYEIYNQVSGYKEFLLLEEGNHVCNNLPYLYRPYASDWLYSKLNII